MASVLKICPKEILATESYTYITRIRKNASVEKDTEPGGAVDVTVPYDGEKYFPMDAADELLPRKNIEQLRIGFLAIGSPKDWQGDWRQKIGAEILDVEIPLRLNGMSEEKWTTDENQVQIRHEYTLERPRYYPVHFDLDVLDIEARSKFVKELGIPKFKLNKASLLSFEILVQVNLPTNLVGPDVSVELEKLVFAWPKFAPKGQIQIHSVHFGSEQWKNSEWMYVPERNEIEVVLDPIKLNADRPVVGSPLSVFWAVFHIDLQFSVGELIKTDELAGRATFRARNILLSGRDITWIDADGHERRDGAKMVHSQTLIHSRFTAYLSDRFENKQSFISREWRFPGVSFSKARIKDIKSILLDHGYSVDDSDVDEAGEEGKIGIIPAARLMVQQEHEPYILQLILEVKGMSASSTKRERREAEEDIYITEINTQDLQIKLSAQINGPGRLLALDVDEIMLKLKDHFTAVADLR